MDLDKSVFGFEGTRDMKDHAEAWYFVYKVSYNPP